MSELLEGETFVRQVVKPRDAYRSSRSAAAAATYCSAVCHRARIMGVTPLSSKDQTYQLSESYDDMNRVPRLSASGNTQIHMKE